MENVAQDKRTVKTLVTDDKGNELATELPGGTVAVTPSTKYSLSSLTPEEQQRILHRKKCRHFLRSAFRIRKFSTRKKP
jgi:hypothetical protein